MYDTVNMLLFSERANDIVKYLDHVRDIRQDGICVVTTGYLRSPSGHEGCDLKVSVDHNGFIRIGKTSLCKWLHGDNLVHYLTRTDTKYCIEAIGDILHMPIMDSNITRLDFGYNMILEGKPKFYIPHLGELARYNRLQIKEESIYYSNSLRKYVVYDKIKEQKSRNKSIPADLKNENIIRLELQINDGVARYFRESFVKTRMLYDVDFYSKCLEYWSNHYYKIQKINNVMLNFGEVTTKTHLYQFGILCAIEKYGELRLLQQIRGAQQSKKLTRKQAHVLREAIASASRSSQFTMECPFIMELDTQINNAINLIKEDNL